MRGIVVGCLGGLLALSGCTKEAPKGPVDQILGIGIQAEKEIADNAAKRDASKDVTESVELGKQETAIVDSAKARIQAILGGKDRRLSLPIGPCTDTLPVIFAHATIGRPDFYKGEFFVNLVISGTGKRPLPEATLFQLVALDSAGKVLSAKDASMVDSLRVGDSLFAGGVFRVSELKGLRSVAAK